MDISVEEWGLAFVVENFKRFQGEGIFFFLMMFALLMLLIAVKQDWKKGMLLYLVGLFLTIFNPLLVTPVIRVLGTDDEYYRLIWLLPVTVLIAWMLVYLIEKGRNILVRILVCIIGAVVVAIPGKTILAKGLQPAENIYKISNEIIEIVEVMHEKSGKEDINVLTEFDLTVVLNQYDPAIHLVIPYADVSILHEYNRIDSYDELLTPDLGAQMDIYEVLYNHLELTWMAFGSALNYTETDFLVLGKNCDMLDYIATQSCNVVHETKNYFVYEFVPFVWDHENLKPIYE